MKNAKVFKVHNSGYDELLHNGFSLFKDDIEQVYAMQIKLDLYSDIVQKSIKLLESEKFKTSSYSQGLQYDQEGYVVLDEDMIKQLTECELCVSLGENEEDLTKGVLFINAPDKVCYYSAEIIQKNCKHIIKALKSKKIIYLSKIGGKK